MAVVGSAYSRDFVHLFSIECSTCGCDYYVWKAMANAPMTCPGSASHTVSAVHVARTEARDYIEEPTARLVEDSSMFDTARNFQIAGHVFSCAAGQSTTYSFTYPVNTSVSSVIMPVPPDNDGGVFSCYIPLGVVAASAVTAGDTSVPVTFEAAAAVGRGANLYASVDGLPEQDIGRVVDVTVTGQAPSLSFEQPVAASGTALVSARMYVAKDLTLRSACGKISIGNSKIGGSSVPAGVSVVCEYYNPGSQVVDVTFYVEYTF